MREREVLERPLTGAKTLCLGFLGAGWIGRHRMEALVKSELVNAVSVFDPDPECLAQALQTSEDAQVCTSYEEMLDDEALDGIVVATPSALHATQAIAALDAKKAVFCQKPLALTAEEAASVVEAARRADRLLGVDFSYRHTAAMQSVKKAIDQKQLGEVYSVDLTFHNAWGPSKPWFYDAELSGGGCLIDLGVHLVDLTLWALGFQEAYDVDSHLFAKGHLLKSPSRQVEDFAVGSFSLSNGTRVRLSCSWHAHAGREAIVEAVFYGTNASARFGNVNGSFYDFKAEKLVGTHTETLFSGSDDWGGKAAIAWAASLAQTPNFNPSSETYIASAKTIDALYGR